MEHGREQDVSDEAKDLHRKAHAAKLNLVRMSSQSQNDYVSTRITAGVEDGMVAVRTLRPQLD